MATFILTSNPDNWAWSDLQQTTSRVQRGESVFDRWSSGNTKTIPIGSRVFLLKQGPEPRGLIASGWTTGAVDEEPHWDEARARRGDTANYVEFAFDVLLDLSTQAPLDPRDFPPGPVREVYWAPPASGTSVPAAAAQLEELWADHAAHACTSVPPIKN